MDFKQLNAFLTIGSLLNFTKAAEQLGYAQSSITVQIQQLEDEFGVKLFERIGKTVTLTHAGVKLIPYAVQMIQLSKDMKLIAANTDTPTGSLTIGAAESLSIYRLPAILTEYRKLYPEVDINLKLLNCTEFTAYLSGNRIDVAFALGDRIETDCTVEELALPEPIHILANPHHPLAKKAEVTPSNLQNESLLLTEAGCGYRGAFMQVLTQDKVTPKVALETNSIQAIKQAAISGLGICVLPAIAVTEEVAAGKLVPLNFKVKGFGIVSQLLVHKDKWISPALSALINLSKQLLENH